MEIVNTLIIIVASLFTLGWIYGIRRKAKIGERENQGNINATFLFLISLLVVFVFNISPLHLFWMFLVGGMMGQLYGTFPFLLITFPAIFFEKLVYIGLDLVKIREKKLEIDETLQQIVEGKLTQEEALKKTLGKINEQKSNSK